MTRLVVVAPLREGTRADAHDLLAEGPPFDLAETRFDRHTVFLTDREVVFVFEGANEQMGHALELQGEDPELWQAAAAWREILDGRPRVAETAFSWERES